MKIINVEAIPFFIPYPKTLSWATGSAEGADHVLVKIVTDTGIAGYAEAIPRPTIYGESQVSICHAITKWFSSILIGADPFSILDIQEKLHAFPGNMTARAAVDMALYDIQARYSNLPLYRFLGGRDIPEGLDLTWMVNLGSLSKMVEQVYVKFSEGFRNFKLKGGINPCKDIELVKLIHQELGDQVDVYLDANQGYDRADAYRVAKSVAEYGVNLVEEPLPVSHMSQRQQLKRSLPAFMRVLGDESVFSSFDILREWQAGTIDLVSLKPARSGVSESRKIANLMQLLGLQFLIGTQGETAIGTLQAGHIAAGVGCIEHPAELSFFSIFNEHLVLDPPRIQKGRLILTESIGSGIAIDEQALRRFRLD